MLLCLLVIKMNKDKLYSVKDCLLFCCVSIYRFIYSHMILKKKILSFILTDDMIFSNTLSSLTMLILITSHLFYEGANYSNFPFPKYHFTNISDKEFLENYAIRFM